MGVEDPRNSLALLSHYCGSSCGLSSFYDINCGALDEVSRLLGQQPTHGRSSPVAPSLD